MDFITTYKSNFIYVAVVLVSWIILLNLTNKLYKWLLFKERQKFPGQLPIVTKLARRILNILWVVLALIALSFLFVNKEYYSMLTSNFRLAAYLGFLAVGTIMGASMVNLWFSREIAKRITQEYDPTSLKFLKSFVFYSIYILGIVLGLLAFPSMRGIAGTALGGAGVLALAMGVASQEALANLVGGIFIISFKPFKVGDVIKVTDTMVGTVSDITLRHTVIRNFENKMIVIPNAIMNKEKLINYDLGEQKCCERIEIGISYDSSVELAKKILQEECQNHPLIYDNRTVLEKADGVPVTKVALISLDDSSVTIRAWAWAGSFGDAFALRCDILTSVKARYEAEGVEIPYPYRTLVIKKENAQDESNTKLDELEVPKADN